MSRMKALHERNAAFVESAEFREVTSLPFIPRQGLYIVTCIDPRTDPARFLGTTVGDAIVARSVGGRVTPEVLQDIAYISYLVETIAPEGPYFEVAVIHHTGCGSALLADDDRRRGFAARIGADEHALADVAVVDPERTVRADVERVLREASIPPQIQVSGHVYETDRGQLTTVVDALPPA